MKRISNFSDQHLRGPTFTSLAMLLAVLLGACSATPPTIVAPSAVPQVVVRKDVSLAALAYYQTLPRMTPAQISRERAMLAGLQATPDSQIRMAMVLGQVQGQQDLNRALGLLDSVLKSTEAEAVSLHPLARLLGDNYSERQKLEAQVDKQEQQLKESRRKAAELQEKIDELADIERTLPQRPRARRSAGGVR